MTMNKEEIARSYREAKYKAAQIGILADLNGCGQDEIKAILEEKGLIVKTERKNARDGNRKRRKKAEVDTRQAAEQLAEENLKDAPVEIELIDTKVKIPAKRDEKLEKEIQEFLTGPLGDAIDLIDLEIGKLTERKNKLLEVCRMMLELSGKEEKDE